MRWIGVLAIGAVLAACKAESFACGGDDQCMLGGDPGLCVVGNCAYPDEACPSGYRYAAGLGNALAGECVADDDVAGTDTELGSGSGSTTTASTTIDPTTTGSSGSIATMSVDVTGPESTSSSGTDTEPKTVTSETTGPITDSMTGPIDDCPAQECSVCFDCAVEQDCATVVDACGEFQGCLEAQQCFAECALAGACQACCVGVPAKTLELAMQVESCREKVCGMACGGFPPTQCDP